MVALAASNDTASVVSGSTIGAEITGATLQVGGTVSGAGVIQIDQGGLIALFSAKSGLRCSR